MKARVLFEEKFIDILESLGIKDFKSTLFIIMPTIKVENYTSWDDMFRLWSTPQFKGIRLTYFEVINSLVKEIKNAIPLWIKVTYKKNLPVLLEISQRFRKAKEISLRNPTNRFAPFEVDNSKQIEQLVKDERIEAIRILLFRRLIDSKLKEIIGNEIDYREIRLIFENHFKYYRFYPPLPNHQRPSDSDFSRYVIDKNFRTGEFSICSASDLDNEIENGLSLIEAINYYIENEMNWNICKIKIRN